MSRIEHFDEPRRFLNYTGLPQTLYHRGIVFSRYDSDALVEVINCYLKDDLTAFKLGDALSEIAARTKDESVKQVVHLFWYHYDDVEDHKVVASKEEWDYFQRLLLILKSDAAIVVETGKRKWTARQPVTAACLAAFGVAVVKTGFGYHLFCATVPLGFFSMLVAHWRSSDDGRRFHAQTALGPFGSAAELFSLRRKVNNFVKARYPARLGSRQIRGPISAAAVWLHSGAAWLLFSPVVLVLQVLPEPEQRWKVVNR